MASLGDDASVNRSRRRQRQTRRYSGRPTRYHGDRHASSRDRRPADSVSNGRDAGSQNSDALSPAAVAAAGGDHVDADDDDDDGVDEGNW